MKAHLFIQKGRFAWSGYGASDDPVHKPYAVIVDIGRDFTVTSEGKLLLTGAGPQQHQLFSPGEVVLAARSRMFGFRVVAEDQSGAWKADKERRRRQKLGRRGRIAEELG